MANLEGYAGYVDTRYLQLAAEVRRAEKEHAYTAMHIAPGKHILDIGCGPGVDTLPLARLVGPTGEVVGLDHDPAMVAEADRQAATSGVSERVHHLAGSATALPFADDHFDASHAERLFQHLEDPQAALAELVRVTRPAGWIVVVDTDYSSITIDSDEIEIERRLARFTAGRVRNAYVARRLHRMFRAQQLADVTLEVRSQLFTDYPLVRLGWLDGVERDAQAAGAISQEELERWHRGLEQSEAAGGFFASLNHILIAGRKA